MQHVTEVLTRRKRQLSDGGDKEDGNDHFIILSRALRAAVLRPIQLQLVQKRRCAFQKPCVRAARHGGDCLVERAENRLRRLIHVGKRRLKLVFRDLFLIATEAPHTGGKLLFCRVKAQSRLVGRKRNGGTRGSVQQLVCRQPRAAEHAGKFRKLCRHRQRFSAPGAKTAQIFFTHERYLLSYKICAAQPASWLCGVGLFFHKSCAMSSQLVQSRYAVSSAAPLAPQMIMAYSLPMAASSSSSAASVSSLRYTP